MKILVGDTGFVGSNLAEQGTFDASFHSANITDAYGSKPDLLYYAGVRGEKFLANQNPKEDKKCVEQAFYNIQKIKPARVVLISTIDVYDHTENADEYTKIRPENLKAYGRNRYWLEQKVRQYDQAALIVRLPALYGKNLKKNFLYDMMNPVPRMLSAALYTDFMKQCSRMEGYYRLNRYGFYELREYKEELEQIFSSLSFRSIQFTDSRSKFQFYPLKRLWKDLETALLEKMQVLLPATEPVSASEVYSYITGRIFVNEHKETFPTYDCRTLYADLFGGAMGYIMRKEEVLCDIKDFMEKCKI